MKKKNYCVTVTTTAITSTTSPHRYNTTDMNTPVHTTTTWTTLSYASTTPLQHLTTTTEAPTKNHQCQNKSSKHNTMFVTTKLDPNKSPHPNKRRRIPPPQERKKI
jgi:hypothetical protein